MSAAGTFPNTGGKKAVHVKVRSHLRLHFVLPTFIAPQSFGQGHMTWSRDHVHHAS